nr:hypothetical protein Iba_chr15cCG8300 [Ipomoea batatas]
MAGEKAAEKEEIRRWKSAAVCRIRAVAGALCVVDVRWRREVAAVLGGSVLGGRGVGGREQRKSATTKPRADSRPTAGKTRKVDRPKGAEPVAKISEDAHARESAHGARSRSST